MVEHARHGHFGGLGIHGFDPRGEFGGLGQFRGLGKLSGLGKLCRVGEFRRLGKFGCVGQFRGLGKLCGVGQFLRQRREVGGTGSMTELIGTGTMPPECLYASVVWGTVRREVTPLDWKSAVESADLPPASALNVPDLFPRSVN